MLVNAIPQNGLQDDAKTTVSIVPIAAVTSGCCGGGAGLRSAGLGAFVSIELSSGDAIAAQTENVHKQIFSISLH